MICSHSYTCYSDGMFEVWLQRMNSGAHVASFVSGFLCKCRSCFSLAASLCAALRCRIVSFGSRLHADLCVVLMVEASLRGSEQSCRQTPDFAGEHTGEDKSEPAFHLKFIKKGSSLSPLQHVSPPHLLHLLLLLCLLFNILKFVDTFLRFLLDFLSVWRLETRHIWFKAAVCNDGGRPVLRSRPGTFW